MNHLQALFTLNNRYHIMRHGHSLANQAGIIISAPESGIAGYGLSETGITQVEKSIRRNSTELGAVSLIISSDFKRANATAEIAHSLLSCPQPILFKAALRERYFGDFEQSGNQHYQTVWAADAVDAKHTHNRVESADAVMTRGTALIIELEAQFSDKQILLVSHGDTLQILQMAFQKAPASQHRTLVPLETAEIRPLTLSNQR